MTILITGHRGFVGSNLVKELDLENISYQLFDGDCCNMADWLKYRGISCLVHCASNNGGIEYNGTHPATIYHNNVLMGLNALEFCKIDNVKTFVSFATSCGFPYPFNGVYHEHDYLIGEPHASIEAHGLAKRSLVQSARFYRKQYGIFSTIFIPNTLYGIGDRCDERSKVLMALVKKFVHAKEHNQTVTLLGDGSPRREFTHISHLTQVLVKYLKDQKYNNIDLMNVGPSEELTIHELATKIANIVDYDNEILWDVTAPNGADRKALSYSLQKMVKLEPKKKVLLNDGLKEVIQWYVDKIGANIKLNGTSKKTWQWTYNR